MQDATLRQLQMLAAVAESRSLAGAAATLHVTAPAVAQQVRLLTKRTGVPLIERQADGLHATEAGHVLVECAHRLQAELAEAAESLEALRTARAGRVRLGAVSTAKYFVPALIGAFRQDHSGIDVALTIGNRSEVLAALEDYAVDLVIMGRSPARLDVVDEVFGDHPYVVIAAPNHPLVARASITVEELAPESFIVREPGSGTRAHADALLGEQPMTIGMEMTSNETIKQAVMAGLGIALISAHTIAAEVADGRLAVLNVVGLPIQRQWRVVRLARRELSPAQRALWEFVARVGRDLLPA